MKCGKTIFKDGDLEIAELGWFLDPDRNAPSSLLEAVANFYKHLLTTNIAISELHCNTKDEVNQFNTSKEKLIKAIAEKFEKFKKNPKYRASIARAKSDFSGDIGVYFEEFMSKEIEYKEDKNPEELDIDDDTKPSTKRMTLKNIVDEIFNGNEAAELYWERNFDQTLSLKIIIDPEHDIYVDSDKELNKQMQLYKEEQYELLRHFLKDVLKVPETIPDSLYIKERAYITVNPYQKALNIFYQYIQQLKESGQLQSKIDNAWDAHMFGKTGSENYDFMNALMAFINLTYFDPLLKGSLGEIIEIDESKLEPISKEEGSNFEYKYSFGKSESKVTGWNSMKEVRDAIDETGGFTKLVIGSIPLLDWKTGRKGSLSRNINLVHFNVAFVNLFSAINKLTHDNAKRSILKDALVKFHIDGTNSITTILSLLFDGNNLQLIDALKKTDLINDFDLNILRSVYERVYRRTRPSDGPIKSFWKTENNYFKRVGRFGAYPVTMAITAVIDRTMPMNYLETVPNPVVENNYLVRIKKKFPNLKTVFDMIETINTNMSIISDRESIKQLGIPTKISDTTWQLNINGTIYTFNISDKSFGILSKSEQTPLQVLGISAYSSIDINNSEKRKQLLGDRSILTQDERRFMELLDFIDRMLQTDFATESGLRKLSVYKQLYKSKNNSSDAWLRELTASAMQAAVINDLYIKFDKLSDDNGEKFPKVQFKEKLAELGMPLEITKLSSTIKARMFGRMFEETVEGDMLKVVYNGQAWLDVLADAVTIISGEVSKAVIKNLSGDSISNYTPSFLGGQIKYELSKQRGSENPSRHLLFALSTNEGAIQETIVDTDVKLKDGTVKPIKKMTQAELFYHGFIDKFVRMQYDRGGHLNTNRTIVILPTTYSDKTKFINYSVNSIITNKNGNIDLMKCPMSELEDTYLDTIGEFYKEVHQGVLNDYYQIFGTTDIVEINKQMQMISKTKSADGRELSVEEQFINLAQAKGITVYRDTHYRLVKINGIVKLTTNELLYEYATNLYASKEAFAERIKKEKLNFLNDLLQSRVSFDKGAQLIELLSEQGGGEISWFSGGKMILAKYDGKNIVFGKKLDDNIDLTKLQINPLLERYFMVSALVNNNMRMSLTGSEINHRVKALEKGSYNNAAVSGIKKLMIFNVDDSVKIPVETKINELTGNNKPIEQMSLVEIKELVKLALSNSTDPVVTSKLQEALTVVNNQFYKIESAAQMAQLKRNVIIPATMQYYLQGCINGIGKEMRWAIVNDVLAKVFNFDGENRPEDAHDGSALVGIFTSILENNSLQDLAVGMIKKPILHHYDALHGTSTLVKFAADTITCAWMRDSHLSKQSLYELHKKMSNLRWSDIRSWGGKPRVVIDLINGNGTDRFFNGRINFQKDILQNNRLFYKDYSQVLEEVEEGQEPKVSESEEIYEIIDFGRDENGVYYTIEKLAESDGTVYSDSETYKVYHVFDKQSNHKRVRVKKNETYNLEKGFHTIDSVFELHESLGGIFSLSYDSKDGFIDSEASAYAVVNFMNSVNIYQGRVEDGHKIDQDDFSLKSYRQPLKELIIDYVANNSAVKNGAGNINLADVLERGNNVPLKYIVLSTDGYGIQMDADHEADEAVMTEFSQVISSLGAGGRMHDYVFPIYEVLGAIALEECEVELEAIAKFNDTEDFSELYDMIGRMIMRDINSGAKTNKSGLADKIIKEVEKRFNENITHENDKYKIPFSDANVYRSIMISFVSTINHKAIKKKYPGLSTVMAPGFNISQIFKIQGTPYMFKDLLKLALKAPHNPKQPNESVSLYYRRIVEEYLQARQEYEQIYEDASFASPTDIVDVGYQNPEGNIIWDTINLDDIKDYYKFKENPILFATARRNRVIISDPYNKVWKSDPTKSNIAFTISLEENPDRKFEIVKDFETGYWSIHFRTLKDDEPFTPGIISEEEKRRLFETAAVAIPSGEFLSSWGEVSEGGIAGLNRFSRLGFTQVGTRLVLHKGTLAPVEIPILRNDNKILFRQNVTIARNLAPVRIRFKYEESEGVWKEMNIFDHHLIKKAFFSNQKELDRDTRQKVFTDLSKGWYIDEHGVPHKAEIIENSDAELIVSNMFRSKFGVSVNDSLIDILNKGLGKPSSRIITADNFDLAFTKNNGNHIYITFDNVVLKANNFDNETRWRTEEFKRYSYEYEDTVPEKDRVIINKLYALDKDGHRLFEIGREVKTTGLRFNNEDKVVRTNEEGKDEIIPNQEGRFLKGNNGEVIERIFFVRKYTIHQKRNKQTVYQIDKSALERCFYVGIVSDEKLHGQTLEQYRENEINLFIGRKLLGRIYNSDKFTGIQLNSKDYSEKGAKVVRGVLSGMKKTLSFDVDMIEMLDKFSGYLDRPAKEGKININKRFVELAIGNYSSKKNKAREASFRKSLEFIASRIPAQTLQSFMKMKCVGFTGSDKNVCYVSHWQTWLQGSDYDIDKAYIMGHNLDENGIYIGWSNLFDYSSIDTLKASEFLPMPKKIIYNVSESGIDITSVSLQLVAIETEIKQHDDNFQKLKKQQLALNPKTTPDANLLAEQKRNIQEQINTELKAIDDLRIQRIKEYVKVLNHIHKQIPRNIERPEDGYPMFGIRLNGVNPEIAKIIEFNLNNHETTQIPRHLRQGALRNYISSHIEGVISDIRNMPSAYTPITMDDLQSAAENSPKGDASSRMTLLNPLVVYKMQYENMVGKNVIGIAAVGEKASFMIHLFYNDLARVSDKEYETDEFQEKLLHSKINFTSKRIIGRHISRKQNGRKLSESEIEAIRKSEAYIGNLNTERVIRSVPDINWDDETNIKVRQIIKDAVKSNLPADLMISQILSAATDNAKELILGKINAGEKLAKIYLFLITMGFDINDIVSFMTSDTITVIDELCEENIFGDFNIRIEDAISLVKGVVPISIVKNIQKELFVINEDGKRVRAGEFKVFDDDNIKKLILGNPKNLTDIPSDPTQREIYEKLLILTDFISCKLKTLENGNQSKEDIIADADEFLNVLHRADEFSRFGGLLGVNQGLPTSKEDLMAFVNKIEKIVTSQEKLLGTNKENIKAALRNKIKDYIIAQYTDQGITIPENIDDIINERTALLIESFENYNLILDFDGARWLLDENYRKVAELYYDIIKSTFNVFTIATSLPHFNAIFKIAGAVLTVDQSTSTKSKLFDEMTKQLKKIGIIPDSWQYPNLSSKMFNFIDTLLVTSFFKFYKDENGESLKFPIKQGQKYLDKYGREVVAAQDYFIDLSTIEGLASFKYIMETTIIPGLKSGKIIDGANEKVVDTSKNDFINGLTLKSENGIPFYRLNIEMNTYMNDDVNVAKFNRYLRGLELLQSDPNFTIGGRSLLDWFILYNLYVNKNSYGNDRMTKIFQEFIESKDNKKSKNILNDYFKLVSDYDFSQSVKEFKFNIDDFLIFIAPLLSKDARLDTVKLPYVRRQRTDNSGEIEYINTKTRRVKLVFPDIPGNASLSNLSRMIMYQRYFLSGLNIYDQLEEINKTLTDVPDVITESSSDEDILKYITFLNTIRDKYIEGLIKLQKIC